MDRKTRPFKKQRKGRQVIAGVRQQLIDMIGNGPYRKDLLIEYLHLIQDSEGHIHSDRITALADLLGLSVVEVFEVATFYHHFDVIRDGETPPPPLTVRVCNSISCSMAGATELFAALQDGLGNKVRVQAVPCVGRCEKAPVAVVGKQAVGTADFAKVKSSCQAKATEPRCRPAKVGFKQYQQQGGYTLLRRCRAGEHPVEELITRLQESGLRGLGGAGFPAGQKWDIVRRYPGPRYMAVNIDEGEPGTFKDRFFLEQDPHRFLEGMLIATWAVAIDRIYVYIRDEYPDCRFILDAALAELNTLDLPMPAVEIRRGAGAYICGEESAMIESIEGKRGMPRLRPPYVAEVGLFGRPTLEHNFETLYWIREILEKGPEFFNSQGRNGRHGLRSFSVSGRVRNPGIKLAPAGITVRELIDEFCGGMLPGHELYGYFPGGASGGILPASLDHVPLDFDTLQEYGCFIGSAAVMVFSQRDQARDLALNAMRFFAHESCGQCTPCRVGTEKAVSLMQAPNWDTALLQELSEIMLDGSICGLGQAAPNPLRCVIKYFPQEIH